LNTVVYFGFADNCHLPFGKFNQFLFMFVRKKQGLKMSDVDVKLMITKKEFLLASVRSSAVFCI